MLLWTCETQWFSTFNHVCFSYYYHWLAVIFFFAAVYRSTITSSVRQPQQQQQTVYYYYILCIHIYIFLIWFSTRGILYSYRRVCTVRGEMCGFPLTRSDRHNHRHRHGTKAGGACVVIPGTVLHHLTTLH